MAGRLDPSPVSLIASRTTEDACDYPGLDRIADRVAAASVAMLQRLGSSHVSIAACQVSIETVAQWQDEMRGCGQCAFEVRPFREGLAFAMSPGLVARIVDSFYGGKGEAEPSDTGFRPADQRMIARIGRYWVDQLPSLWKDVATISPRIMALDGCHPFDRDEATRLVVQRFAVTIGTGDPCAISWAYPVALLRQMPELARHARAQRAPGRDPAWQTRLASAVNEVSLPVRTIFARPELPVSQLLGLMPGDVIPLCLPSSVPVTVGGRVFAEGTVGESSGRTAIRISRILKGASDHERY